MTPSMALTSSLLMLLLAAVFVESAPCVPFTSALNRAGYPEAVHAQFQGFLSPFFQGVMFLPSYANLKAYQAANPGSSLRDLVYHHAVPFLSVTDPSAASGMMVRTMVDLVDNPTLCPAGETTMATVMFTTAGGAASVNGVPVVSEPINVCDVGTVLGISDVAPPTCVPTPSTVKAVVVKPPPKKVDKCATAKTVLQVLSTLEGGAKLLARSLPQQFSGTVFVPTATAMAALSTPTLSFLSDPLQRAMLSDVLLYHAVPKKVLTPDASLPPTGLVATLLSDSKKQSLCKGGADGTLQVAGVTGQPLTVTAKATSNGGAAVAPAVVQSIPACNGMVYLIDSVMLPCDPLSMVPAVRPSPKRSPPRKPIKKPATAVKPVKRPSAPVKAPTPNPPAEAAPLPKPSVKVIPTPSSAPGSSASLTDPSAPPATAAQPSLLSNGAAGRGAGGSGWRLVMMALALLCAALLTG